VARGRAQGPEAGLPDLSVRRTGHVEARRETHRTIRPGEIDASISLPANVFAALAGEPRTAATWRSWREVDPGRPALAPARGRSARVAPPADRAVDILERLQVFSTRVQRRRQAPRSCRRGSPPEQPSAVRAGSGAKLRRTCVVPRYWPDIMIDHDARIVVSCTRV